MWHYYYVRQIMTAIISAHTLLLYSNIALLLTALPEWHHAKQVNDEATHSHHQQPIRVDLWRLKQASQSLIKHHQANLRRKKWLSSWDFWLRYLFCDLLAQKSKSGHHGLGSRLSPYIPQLRRDHLQIQKAPQFFHTCKQRKGQH